MDIRAVAFDIDGTLYPNALMYIRSVCFSLPRLRFLYHYGRVRRKIRMVRPIVDFRETQARLLGEAMGITGDRARAMIERRIYLKWQRIFSGVRPYPHLQELIERLRAGGMRLGVLSDFPIGRKLEYLRLDGAWDCLISAEDTGYLKPNPEPFLSLAECLGFEPHEILYIGNNYDYDIVGASRVGMKTAHLAREPAGDTIADLTFSDYRELTSELLGVAQG